MENRILVIGATGRLGEPVARELHARGYAVRVLSRSPEKARARFGPEYEVVRGDVEDPASLAAALAGCRGVHVNLDGKFDPDLERRGGENTARVAAETGVERMTYLSGASVCAENLWYAGTRARYEAEQAIQRSGVPFTIFRAHFFMETLHNFARGKVVLQIGRHPHPYYWIAAADYARMVAQAYATPAAAGKILYACGPEALTMRQTLAIFRRIVHPAARLVPLPLWAAGLLARAGNRRELQAALPFFHYCERVQIILSGSPAEANALLGAPATTVEEWCQAQVK